MARTFLNPHHIREFILCLRVAPLDPLAGIRTYDVAETLPDSDVPTGSLRHYASIESTISNAQALAGLANPETAGEIASLVRLAAARGVAAAVPNYATWTQAQFLTWYNANISPTQINAVSTLAQAKVVMLAMSVELKALAQLIIAARDQLWPDMGS